MPELLTLDEIATPGRVLGDKYRLKKIIGQGGMGLVASATHVQLGQRVAIKLVRPRANEPADHARILREARICAQLRSEHIARALDIGELDGGVVYIVMEWLEGRDFALELADRAPLPADETVDVILQACAGLAEAHAAGLVHRDIKPANLFLAERPLGQGACVKVIDFGLSMADGGDKRLTATLGTMGTPQYMAPEQVLSGRDVSPRSDLFSLALVAYEAIAGRPAFFGKNFTESASKILYDEPAPLTDDASVPVALWRVIHTALAKQAADRYADMAAFAAALAPFAKSSPDAWVTQARSALKSPRRIAGATGVEAVLEETMTDKVRAEALTARVPRVELSESEGDLEQTVQRKAEPKYAHHKGQGAGWTVRMGSPTRAVLERARAEAAAERAAEPAAAARGGPSWIRVALVSMALLAVIVLAAVALAR